MMASRHEGGAEEGGGGHGLAEHGTPRKGGTYEGLTARLPLPAESDLHPTARGTYLPTLQTHAC